MRTLVALLMAVLIWGIPFSASATCTSKEFISILQSAAGLIDRPTLPPAQAHIAPDVSDMPQYLGAMKSQGEETRDLAKQLMDGAKKLDDYQKRQVQFWEIADICLPQIQR